jgi:LysM repeat protein
MALEKALITNADTAENFEVLFNPEEYTINKDNNFAQMAVPGLRSPLLQFIHGNLQTLEMELLVDSYETHASGGRTVTQAGDDVRTLTSKITGLLDINADTHAPPVLLFTWGSLSFTCVLAKASQKFIMFRPDGIPVRARLQVTFNEFTNADTEAKEIKRQTSTYSKIYVVGQGDTLSSIATKLYQDPSMWRPIAMRNQIEDPRALAVGQQLLVPSLPYQDPESGEIVT